MTVSLLAQPMNLLRNKYCLLSVIFLLTIFIVKPAVNHVLAVLPADANSDGKVDGLDYVIWLNSYNQTVAQGAIKGDFDNSGLVDGLDYVIWLNNYDIAGLSPTPHTTNPPTPTVSSPGTPFRPFISLNISSSEIAFNVNGAGSNIDSIAFWEAPDPAKSLMFVTSKSTNLVEVWNYPFKQSADQLPPIQNNSCMNSSGTNGVIVDQEDDLLFVTTRYGNRVCVFGLPGLNLVRTVTTGASGSWDEPNLALLKLGDGQKNLYISYNSKVYIHNALTGAAISQFTPQKGLETMFGDNFYREIYIPDEAGMSGIYRYDSSGTFKGSFGGSSVFNADEEGIWVYSCPSSGTGDNGDGLIIVSDQLSPVTDFEVFNRKTKEHLGKININGVSNTDGISISQQSSPLYPKGLLAVLNNDSSVTGVGWDTIFQKLSMACPN